MSILKEIGQKRIQGKKIKHIELLGSDYTTTLIKDHGISRIHIAEVVDYELSIRIKDASKKTGAKITVYDSPNFLLNNTDVKNDFSNKSFTLWQTL